MGAGGCTCVWCVRGVLVCAGVCWCVRGVLVCVVGTLWAGGGVEAGESQVALEGTKVWPFQ